MNSCSYKTMSIKGGRAFLLLFVILILLDLIQSKERIWRFDTDISNPANWIEGKLAEGCKGIHFSPINSASAYIKQLTTEELVLPTDGEIAILDGGSIDFKDNHKCIKLKPLDYHNWYDSDSWEKSDENAAVPHKERIPCDHDDIAFPKGIHTRVSEQLSSSIEVKSIKFAEQSIKQEDLANIMGGDIFFNPIDQFTFNINNQSCVDPYGCYCHRDYVPCPNKQYPKPPCLEPIEPEDFCHQICGASITFYPKSGFQLNNLQEKLKKYTVDTHASRLRDYMGNDVIQVVFSEKEYVGNSLNEAQNFLDEIKVNEKFDIENAQMQKSGHFYTEGSGSGSAVGIVFGTLVVVAMFFGILLYLNGDTRTDLIISRLNRGRGSLFTVPFFARFDTTDENLVIDSQSTSGSVLDIARAFDNPMFGKIVPGTSTEPPNPSDDPLDEVKLKKREDESDVEE